MINIGGRSPTAHSFTIDYYYKKITDDNSGTEAVIWTPASGKSIHVMAVLVSVTAKGMLEFKDGTTDATIVVFVFEEKKTVPFSPGMELGLPRDHPLKAKFTVDTGTGDVHITAFGDEH